MSVVSMMRRWFYLRQSYQAALDRTQFGDDPYDTPDNALRRRVIPVSRRAIDELRRSGAIGDDAYRMIEEELDWLELSARSQESS